MYSVIRNVELDAIFGALADPSRRSMLTRLTGGETSVSELARPLDMSMPAVLKHLRVLEDAGLVTAVKDGRVKQCRLEPEPLRAVNDWLAQTYHFWNTQLDGLARHFESNESSRSTSKEKTAWPPRPPRCSKPRSAASTGSRAGKSSERGRTRTS